MQNMSRNTVAPVVIGLAIGVGFIVLFSLAFNSAHLPALKISEKQAVGIGVQDLTTKYIRNPEAVKIFALVGEHNGAYIPVDSLGKGGNLTHTIVHSEPNGAFHLINAETHYVMECHIPSCPLREEGMKSIEGRLAWIVDLISSCADNSDDMIGEIYAIDAESGAIIYRTGSPLLDQPYVCS